MRLKVELEVDDRDGRPYYLVFVATDAVSMDAAKWLTEKLFRAYRRHQAEADRLGCLLREIPALGSTDPGPFHPSFQITREDGRITKIVRV